MNKLFLGIDTSNYKTSIAVTDEERRIVSSRSEFLEVEQGKCGLRQSVAFFKQTNALPPFFEDLFSKVSPADIRAIAVSDAPRRISGSYMPVFTAGTNAAKILASALGTDLYTFSHQEGHIAAAVSTLDIKEDEEFIFFHLSGGTTECLLCSKRDGHYDTEIIGGTLDISIGQLFDRIGVKAGYAFPAGKYLDEMASGASVEELPCKIQIKDGYFNLSGIETQMCNAVGEGKLDLIPGLFRRISELLFDDALFLSEKYDIDRICISGGVASSDTIRNDISELVRKHKSTPGTQDVDIMFGSKALSGDNSVGISLLGGRAYDETCKRNTGK